jgi:hypothetical protein
MDPSLTRRADAPDRSVGQRREALALARCQVSPRKTVAGLNARQRRDLIKALTHSLSH